jgi:hypothetical protein
MVERSEFRYFFVVKSFHKILRNGKVECVQVKLDLHQIVLSIISLCFSWIALGSV